MEKATMKDLIARKLQKEAQATQVYDIPVKSLGKTISIKRPTDTQRLDFIDEIGSEPNARTMLEAYGKLIYHCTPILQSKELHEELGIVDPYDTVRVIFDMDDITDIGEKLIDAMGPVEEKVKN